MNRLNNLTPEEALQAARLHDAVAEHFEKKVERLIRIHDDDGVMPSWVSDEVSVTAELAELYRTNARSLRKDAGIIEEDK